jgi:hypothetical protein
LSICLEFPSTLSRRYFLCFPSQVQKKSFRFEYQIADREKLQRGFGRAVEDAAWASRADRVEENPLPPKTPCQRPCILIDIQILFDKRISKIFDRISLLWRYRVSWIQICLLATLFLHRIHTRNLMNEQSSELQINETILICIFLPPKQFLSYCLFLVLVSRRFHFFIFFRKPFSLKIWNSKPLRAEKLRLFFK